MRARTHTHPFYGPLDFVHLLQFFTQLLHKISSDIQLHVARMYRVQKNF